MHCAAGEEDHEALNGTDTSDHSHNDTHLTHSVPSLTEAAVMSLFAKYGQNGSLSLDGFKELLESLGLGHEDEHSEHDDDDDDDDGHEHPDDQDHDDHDHDDHDDHEDDDEAESHNDELHEHSASSANCTDCLSTQVKLEGAQRVHISAKIHDNVIMYTSARLHTRLPSNVRAQ